MLGWLAGKIRVWHEVDKWDGQTAAAAYEGPLKKALAKAYPKATSHVVLEDNDPTGCHTVQPFRLDLRYKSNAAMKAKKDSKIKTMSLPKRSPDLNVLDYSLWSVGVCARTAPSLVTDQPAHASGGGFVDSFEEGVA